MNDKKYIDIFEAAACKPTYEMESGVNAVVESVRNDTYELIAKKDKEIAILAEMMHLANDLIQDQRDELNDLYADMEEDKNSP